MPVQDQDYKDALRSEQKLRHALATIVNALDAMSEHANLVRIGLVALADDCSSCEGSGSAGPLGCTDCLGTGVDPQSVPMMGTAAALPPVPTPFKTLLGPLPMFTAQQMREYALSARGVSSDGQTLPQQPTRDGGQTNER